MNEARMYIKPICVAISSQCYPLKRCEFIVEIPNNTLSIKIRKFSKTTVLTFLFFLFFMKKTPKTVDNKSETTIDLLTELVNMLTLNNSSHFDSPQVNDTNTLASIAKLYYSALSNVLH